MAKLIEVDMIITVAGLDTPVPARLAELLLTQTGEQLVDGVLRRYYAAHPPLRLLVVSRAGCAIELVRIGQYLEAYIGWDDGDARFALPADVGKRHTKITVDRILDAPAPRDEVVTLHSVVKRAPRSDRPGGMRSDELGRPPLVPGETAEAHNITLPATMWRRIEDVGRGNRSAGVRALVERVFPEESPVQLPYDLKRALRAFPAGTAAAVEINGQTAIIVKTTRADAQSAHRPGVPVAFRSELGLYPAAAVIRLALEIHDKPDRPILLDTFLDPGKAADYKLLRRLTGQDTLDLHIFDEQVSYQYTKRIPFREIARNDLALLLDQALAHNKTIAPDARNWQQARDQMLTDTEGR